MLMKSTIVFDFKIKRSSTQYAFFTSAIFKINPIENLPFYWLFFICKVFSLEAIFCGYSLSHNCDWQGVHFTNILRAAFLYKSGLRIFFPTLQFEFVFFGVKTVCKKAAHKMLMKMTRGKLVQKLQFSLFVEKYVKGEVNHNTALECKARILGQAIICIDLINKKDYF